jgi:hypothetical protein
MYQMASSSTTLAKRVAVGADSHSLQTSPGPWWLVCAPDVGVRLRVLTR